MRYLLVALAVAGCSASPQYADTCEPAELAVPVDCPSCTSADIDLSRRVWGVYSDPGAADALAIDVVAVPCQNPDWLGCARLDDGVIEYAAGGPYVDITIAHEVGHFMGLDHDDAPCSLMNGEGVVGYGCGAVSANGCEYAVGDWAP